MKKKLTVKIGRALITPSYKPYKLKSYHPEVEKLKDAYGKSFNTLAGLLKAIGMKKSQFTKYENEECAVYEYNTYRWATYEAEIEVEVNESENIPR